MNRKSKEKNQRRKKLKKIEDKTRCFNRETSLLQNEDKNYVP